MADNKLSLEIVAPLGVIFTGEAESVSIPSFQGTITILPHHTAIFTKLAEGEVEVKTGGRTLNFVISGGFLEVQNNSVHILSDYAIRAESIEIAKSEAKKKLAEEKLQQKLSNKEFTSADKDLRMSILELKIAQKMRRKQHV